MQRPDGRVDYAYMSAGVERLFGLSPSACWPIPTHFGDSSSRKTAGGSPLSRSSRPANSHPSTASFANARSRARSSGSSAARRRGGWRTARSCGTGLWWTSPSASRWRKRCDKASSASAQNWKASFPRKATSDTSIWPTSLMPRRSSRLWITSISLLAFPWRSLICRAKSW